MCAGWLPDNVLPGSSGSVLLTPLAAGITLRSRYSCLVAWYVALCFIGFVRAGLGGCSGCSKRAGEERR